MSQTLNSTLWTSRTPVPRCLIPRRLENIAADALACHMLPDILLPLRKLFAGRVVAPLDELKAMKTKYWSDMRLGRHDSKVRHIMSRSFIDALDYHYGDPSFKATRGLALQLLFGCEAGHLESMDILNVDAAFTLRVMKLVEFMAPLYITSLHDTCINFPKPVFVLGCIMHHSPYLKNISIKHNVCDIVLLDIATRCRQVQVLNVDVIQPESGVELSVKDLMEAFFNELTSDQVEERFLKGEQVPVTFKHLKHLHLRYDVLPGPSIVSFVECVLNCYHNMTIEFGSCICWPFNSYNDLLEPLLTPSLIIGRQKSGRKMGTTFLWSREKAEWEDAEKATSTVFHSCWSYLHGRLEILDDLHGSFYSIKEIRYIYCRAANVYSTVDIHESFGATLKELFICGIIENKNDLESLIQNLNECPNLQTLYLCLVVRFLRTITDLKPLAHLQCLYVYLNSIDEENDSTIQEVQELLKLFLPLLRAAPNLQMLEMPGSTLLLYILNHGLLTNLHTLSIKDHINLPSQELVDNLHKLRNLKVLVINHGFQYIKYVALKRLLRYSDLQINFKRERMIEA